MNILTYYSQNKILYMIQSNLQLKFYIYICIKQRMFVVDIWTFTNKLFSFPKQIIWQWTVVNQSKPGHLTINCLQSIQNSTFDNKLQTVPHRSFENKLFSVQNFTFDNELSSIQNRPSDNKLYSIYSRTFDNKLSSIQNMTFDNKLQNISRKVIGE